MLMPMFLKTLFQKKVTTKSAPRVSPAAREDDLRRKQELWSRASQEQFEFEAGWPEKYDESQRRIAVRQRYVRLCHLNGLEVE